MLDFKTELKKYKPILELDGVEESVNSGKEIRDIIDLLEEVAEIRSPQRPKIREE